MANPSQGLRPSFVPSSTANPHLEDPFQKAQLAAIRANQSRMNVAMNRLLSEIQGGRSTQAAPTPPPSQPHMIIRYRPIASTPKAAAQETPSGSPLPPFKAPPNPNPPPLFLQQQAASPATPIIDLEPLIELLRQQRYAHLLYRISAVQAQHLVRYPEIEALTAWSWIGLGYYDAAAQIARDILARAPNYLEGRNILHYLAALGPASGVAEQNFSLLKQAVKSLEINEEVYGEFLLQFYRTDSESIHYYYYVKGLVHVKRGEHFSAIQSFTEGLRHKPDSITLLNARAFSYFAEGLRFMALYDIELALQIEPSNGYLIRLKRTLDSQVLTLRPIQETFVESEGPEEGIARVVSDEENVGSALDSEEVVQKLNPWHDESFNLSDPPPYTGLCLPPVPPVESDFNSSEFLDERELTLSADKQALLTSIPNVPDCSLA